MTTSGQPSKDTKSKKRTASRAVASRSAKSSEGVQKQDLDTFLPEMLEAKPITKSGDGRSARIFSSQFSGPVPPPGLMEGYKKVDPAFPDRIMKMAEKEQDHRHVESATLLDYEYDLSKRGLHLAAGVGVALIAAAVPISIFGQSWLAGAFGAGGVFTVVAGGILEIFVGKKTKPSKEKDSEENSLPGESDPKKTDQKKSGSKEGSH